MMIERRSLLAGLSATLLAPRLARAASVTDSVGRTITIPDKVERVFAAGPPAAILLYTFAPELLLGWTRSLEPAQCEFLGAGGVRQTGSWTSHRPRQHHQSRSVA
jgi:iron complex transport system substrate-binding protein